MPRRIPAIFVTILIVLFPFASVRAIVNIHDGDLIKTADSFDIYIVKIKNSKKFKRLILNPAIFNSYGHLKWESVKTIAQSVLDEYKVSEFVVEVNPDGSVADPKVYKVSSAATSDVGERRWINITAQEFEALGYDWDSIYFVNSTEASPDFYSTKSPLAFADLSEVIQTPLPPVLEQPKKSAVDTSSPINSKILATKILADSAEITWETNENAASLVAYGTSESSLSFSATSTVLQSSTSTLLHSVMLTNLEPTTKYYYQAIATDPTGNKTQIVTNLFTTTDCYGDVPAVHSTIQKAIDAVNRLGGKICVAEGMFTENLIVDGKDVRLVGKGAGKTVMKANGKNVTVTVKKVGAATTIEGVSIEGGNPYGIVIEDASPVIKNSYVKSNSGGIRVLGNSRPDIQYNVFDGNLNGASIAHNGSVGDYGINHNTFLNNGKGGGIASIVLDSIFPTSPIRITNNIFSKNFMAMHEITHSNFYIWNNLFHVSSDAHLQRQNSFYYSASAINNLSPATKNIESDPLLDSAYKPGVNSSALNAATDNTNIGAY